MRRKWLFLITCGALLLSSLTLNDAHATSPSNLPSFNQNSPGINFDGGAYSTIEISANPNFEVGCDDFTIDWWQKASSQQSSYPRLFQFGNHLMTITLLRFLVLKVQLHQMITQLLAVFYLELDMTQMIL